MLKAHKELAVPNTTSIHIKVQELGRFVQALTYIISLVHTRLGKTPISVGLLYNRVFHITHLGYSD